MNDATAAEMPCRAQGNQSQSALSPDSCRQPLRLSLADDDDVYSLLGLYSLLRWRAREER